MWVEQCTEMKQVCQLPDFVQSKSFSNTEEVPPPHFCFSSHFPPMLSHMSSHVVHGLFQLNVPDILAALSGMKGLDTGVQLHEKVMGVMTKFSENGISTDLASLMVRKKNGLIF
jgi:hypothetical protein